MREQKRVSKFDIGPEEERRPMEQFIPTIIPDHCSPGVLATLVQKEQSKSQKKTYLPYTPLPSQVPEYLLSQQQQVDCADPPHNVQEMVDGVFRFIELQLTNAAQQLERNSSKAKQVAQREKERNQRLARLEFEQFVSERGAGLRGDFTQDQNIQEVLPDGSSHMDLHMGEMGMQRDGTAIATVLGAGDSRAGLGASTAEPSGYDSFRVKHSLTYHQSAAERKQQS